jgi:hypothetical protein
METQMSLFNERPDPPDKAFPIINVIYTTLLPEKNTCVYLVNVPAWSGHFDIK